MRDSIEHSQRKKSGGNVESDLLKTLGPPGIGHKSFVILLSLLVAWGLVAYVHQLRIGLAATAMSDYFSWGVYIVNFVFFIGISMAGSLISAMLRLTNAPWRHPISRLSEVITVFSLLIAGPMIIIDMGRPDRFWHVLWYGRLQSPILWDVLSLTSYLAGSFLYLYVPMIPDLAILRDTPGLSRWRKRLYGTMAMRWHGTAEQHRRLERAVAVMAIVIIPVAVSIHTVTAWLFGMTLRPGWHSTIIGPDFVVGALYSGVAAVITVIALFRHFLRLQAYIPPDHLNKLAKLMLVFGCVYAYFVINEHVGPAYTGENAERPLLEKIMTGSFARQFWAMVGIGLVLPMAILVTPAGRRIGGITTAAILVNVGMWIKRYIIVVPTLASPYMPVRAGATMSYVPTWVEWSITAGGFAAFLLLFVLFSKVFPVISISEMDQTKWPKPAPKPAAVAAITAGAPGMRHVIWLALIVMAMPMAAWGQTRPSIAVTSDVEDGKKMIHAAVTLNGKPVENVTLDYFIQRTFGNLQVGEDTTLDDGTSAVAFPTDLPGSADKNLHTIVKVKSPDKYANVSATAAFGADQPHATAADEFPRALWAPQAPLALVASIFVVVGCVWACYFFVIGQVWAIRKGGRQ